MVDDTGGVHSWTRYDLGIFPLLLPQTEAELYQQQRDALRDEQAVLISAIADPAWIAALLQAAGTGAIEVTTELSRIPKKTFYPSGVA